MKFELMRRIDYLVGPPILWLIRNLVTSRVRSLGGDRFPTRVPKSVLLMKFVGAGSITLSFPLLQELKKHKTRITYLTFPSQVELLKQSGLVDQIWVIHPSALLFIPTVFRFFYRVRQHQFTALVDLEPTANFTAILAGLSRIKTRVGFLCGLPKREAVFTHLVAINSHRHMAQDILATGQVLGLDVEIDPKDPDQKHQLVLPPFEASTGRGVTSIRAHSSTRLNLLNQSIPKILINTTSSELLNHLRTWPMKNWTELSKSLLKHTDHLLIFTGMQQDHLPIEALRKQLPQPGRAYNLAGWTTMPELLELLRDSELVVTLDSGITHLAAWTDTPQVALFGPETPKLYGPVSDRATVIWKNLSCSPCATLATGKRSRCLDNQCMKQISVEEVLSACLKILKKQSARLRA